MFMAYSLVLAASNMQLRVIKSKYYLSSLSFIHFKFSIQSTLFDYGSRCLSLRSSFLFLSSHASKNMLAICEVYNFRQSLTPFSSILITASSLTHF